MEEQKSLKLKQQTQPIRRERMWLRCLYGTRTGRFCCKLAAKPISKACGRFLDSDMSRVLIRGFVRRNGIDLAEYEPVKYRCFNDCFMRQVLPEKRPIDKTPEHLIAPCDGLLSAWHIHDDLILPVKQSRYTISDLLQDSRLAEQFRNGTCLVFRLCVDNYHRYCYPDSGISGEPHAIDGTLHTVRPVATRGIPVYTRNCRAYTILRSEHFGTIVQMEVGAMLVGKICNRRNIGHVVRGEEKGHFAYGGSTVILLLEKNRLKLDNWIYEAALCRNEIPVRMGEWIGTSVEKYSAADS